MDEAQACRCYQLVPITCHNYEVAMSLCVAPEQERYVGTVAEAIALAHFNADMHMLAIHWGEAMIGFAMYSDQRIAEGKCWINRFLIHCTYQGQGHGRTAFRMLVTYIFRRHHLCTKLHIVVDPANTVACRLYEGVGFVFEKMDSPTTTTTTLSPRCHVRTRPALWLGTMVAPPLLTASIDADE